MVFLTQILETIVLTVGFAGILTQDHLAHTLELTAAAVFIRQFVYLTNQVFFSLVNQISGIRTRGITQAQTIILVRKLLEIVFV